jgi:ABC-2 type transport system ATP-binding protein
MLEVRDLVRRAGGRKILDGVTFRAAAGEVLGLLGPNGAGKTTLLRTLAGCRPADAGGVRIAGLDPVTCPREARGKLGYLPERLDCPGAPTIREHVEFVARVRGLSRGAVRRETERVLAEVGLGNLGSRRWSVLSQGERKRAGLAASLVGDPEVLLLDEPTSGLDPEQLVRIRELLRNQRGRRTVLLSTHLLPEVAANCDRVVILHEGRVRAEGTPTELGANDASVTVSARGPVDRILDAILAVEGVAEATVRARRGDEADCVVQPRAGCDVRAALAAAVVQGGFELVEIGRERSALEEAFVRVVASEERPS